MEFLECRALYGRVDWNVTYIIVAVKTFMSRSLRARGLKLAYIIDQYYVINVALFTGAWIEIIFNYIFGIWLFVALFTGAWIEMLQPICKLTP